MDVRETPVDSPDAVAMLDEYFAERERGFVGGNYRTTRPDPEAFRRPRGVFVTVVDDEGTLVGCGGIRRLTDSAEGVRFEVKHLYLAPSTRGRGWGARLLAELEDRARELGADEMVLDTNSSLTAAGRLYASAGYRSVPPYNDNPNATHWYAKRLGGADGG